MTLVLCRTFSRHVVSPARLSLEEARRPFLSAGQLSGQLAPAHFVGFWFIQSPERRLDLLSRTYPALVYLTRGQCPLFFVCVVNTKYQFQECDVLPARTTACRKLLLSAADTECNAARSLHRKDFPGSRSLRCNRTSRVVSRYLPLLG